MSDKKKSEKKVKIQENSLEKEDVVMPAENTLEKEDVVMPAENTLEKENIITLDISENIITLEKEEEDDEDLEPFIPKRIFQTHKSIEYIQSNPILVNAINSWRQYVPEFGYHFYTDEMCHEFMKNEMVPIFGTEILQAYERLTMGVMRADLWRYCIVYKYGGIYADTDAICMCNPNIFSKHPTLLVCAPENNTHFFCQWTFAAPKKSPILKNIIELSIFRILNIAAIKGEHVIHYLTGPDVFTAGIEKYLYEFGQPVFRNKMQYNVYKNSIMICFNHEIFHEKMIKHLFFGSQHGGWSDERFQTLM